MIDRRYKRHSLPREIVHRANKPAFVAFFEIFAYLIELICVHAVQNAVYLAFKSLLVIYLINYTLEVFRVFTG